MDKMYSDSQIKGAWASYKTAICWRTLKAGKWSISLKSPGIQDGVTKSEMVKLSQYVSFPKWLEINNT